jgi:hypothetical protein
MVISRLRTCFLHHPLDLCFPVFVIRQCPDSLFRAAFPLVFVTLPLFPKLKNRLFTHLCLCLCFALGQEFFSNLLVVNHA